MAHCNGSINNSRRRTSRRAQFPLYLPLSSRPNSVNTATTSNLDTRFTRVYIYDRLASAGTLASYRCISELWYTIYTLWTIKVKTAHLAVLATMQYQKLFPARVRIINYLINRYLSAVDHPSTLSSIAQSFSPSHVNARVDPDSGRWMAVYFKIRGETQDFI